MDSKIVIYLVKTPHICLSAKTERKEEWPQKKCYKLREEHERAKRDKQTCPKTCRIKNHHAYRPGIVADLILPEGY